MNIISAIFLYLVVRLGSKLYQKKKGEHFKGLTVLLGIFGIIIGGFIQKSLKRLVPDTINKGWLSEFIKYIVCDFTEFPTNFLIIGGAILYTH